ncbi:MAG: pyridoxal phosphate-dependent aminotransferase [Candidatus Omnitrophica bacterium]|nr:pyridoxal phosphate-dependent aminotransferase [Candidatus Omnitrophota bacterium]
MNPRVFSLNESATLKITALTKKLIKEGKDVVNFAAGEPDFDTPLFIKQAAKAAIDEGFTKYTPSSGRIELKEAIAGKLWRENKIEASADNIIVTSGAKYAIFTAMFTVLSPGDEVIIPQPYWVSYPQICKLVSAKAVFLPASESNNFKIDAGELKKTITSKTKLLILNYPNNPTGATYSRYELEKIFEVIKEKNIFVLSDEIYEILTYDGREHISFASLPGAFSSTITINGFSKTFSMTGWRIGYLAADKGIIGEASKIIDHTTSCASSISQSAALAALGGRAWQKDLRTKFQERRNILWKGLSSLSELNPIKPQGTFYMFCDIRGTGMSSFDFSTKLLEKFFVSCIPADVFGEEGYVRFSFATSLEQISKGIVRIGDFLKNGKNNN